MKSSLLLTFLLATAIGLSAQDKDQKYQFVDKDGALIADGTELVRTDAEDNGFEVLLRSGLYVKNAGAPDDYSVRVDSKVTRIDNGTYQICFPVNCHVYSAPGTYQSEVGVLAAGEQKDILSEWIPDNYGECVVTYTVYALMKFGKTYIDYEGPSVTVTFNYSSPDAIGQHPATGSVDGTYYDLYGHRLGQVGKGLNIVRMSDGTVRKVMMK